MKPTRRSRKHKLPYPWMEGDSVALGVRVADLVDLSPIAPVTDDEIIASIERLIGRPIHDRRSVIIAIDKLADVVVRATVPPVS